MSGPLPIEEELRIAIEAKATLAAQLDEAKEKHRAALQTLRALVFEHEAIRRSDAKFAFLLLERLGGQVHLSQAELDMPVKPVRLSRADTGVVAQIEEPEPK